MTSEYLAMQVIATLLLLIFSILLGIRNRHLGFGTLGLGRMLTRFDAHRKTAIGHMVRKPRVVRHARDASRLALWGIAPSLLTLAALALLVQNDRYYLVPILAVPFGAALFLAFWWIQRLSVPAYQKEYDEYLRLTAPGNRWIEGCIADEPSQISSGGRIISVHVRETSGHVRTVRFFVDYHVDQYYWVSSCHQEVVRLLYSPALLIDGEPIRLDDAIVDGELQGLQRLSASKPALSRELKGRDYEQVRGAQASRTAGIAR